MLIVLKLTEVDIDRNDRIGALVELALIVVRYVVMTMVTFDISMATAKSTLISKNMHTSPLAYPFVEYLSLISSIQQ